MEAENKIRKPRETDDPDRNKKRKLASPVLAEGSPPSESEVEEFFAIVRRMHVAVKYFERTAGSGGGDERGRMWRSALESGAGIATAVEEEGVKKEEERPGAAAPVEGVGAFDLNAVPEEGPGDD